MTNKDKIIAAFLVSIGVFSATQAAQYVRTLSVKEKKILIPAASVSTENIFLCAGSSTNEAVVEVKRTT